MHNHDGCHGLNFRSKQTYLQRVYLAVKLNVVSITSSSVSSTMSNVAERGTSRLLILCLLCQIVLIEIPKFIASIFSVILIFKFPSSRQFSVKTIARDVNCPKFLANSEM
jgi:hypothetical protein